MLIAVCLVLAAVSRPCTAVVCCLQPDNIYEFGAHYFAELLAKEQDKAGTGGRAAAASSSNTPVAT
jgi:hypothetical protein